MSKFFIMMVQRCGLQLVRALTDDRTWCRVRVKDVLKRQVARDSGRARGEGRRCHYPAGPLTARSGIAIA